MTREDYKEIVWSQSGLESTVKEVDGVTDAVWISRVSVLQLVDIIHNDFESHKCENCKWYIVAHQKELAYCTHKNGLVDNLFESLIMKNFSCSLWTKQDD